MGMWCTTLFMVSCVSICLILSHVQGIILNSFLLTVCNLQSPKELLQTKKKSSSRTCRRN